MSTLIKKANKEPEQDKKIPLREGVGDMPIWGIIIIVFFCSYLGSIFGGLATFGIIYGNKKFWSKTNHCPNSDSGEKIKKNDEGK